jgi:hypothetical protein
VKSKRKFFGRVLPGRLAKEKLDRIHPVMPKKLQHVKNKRIDVCLVCASVHADKRWREEIIGTIQGCKVGERKALGAISNCAEEAAAHKNRRINLCLACASVPCDTKSN